MGEANNTSHLEKVERGYEKMDHYSVDFKKERKALSALNFITGKNELFSCCSYYVTLDKLIGLKNGIAGAVAALKSVSALFSPQPSCRWGWGRGKWRCSGSREGCPQRTGCCRRSKCSVAEQPTCSSSSATESSQKHQFIGFQLQNLSPFLLLHLLKK